MAHAVAALRVRRDALSKLASLGATGNDQAFEEAFASLANAYLTDKAPKLLDYLVGFQLLDRSSDGDRAAGIMGFKVGNQWVYCPVFFVNGNLKGHELLFIKSQKTFVPLHEGWVNRLLNKRPVELGHGVPRNLRTLGVMSPEYSRMNSSPAKFASWLAPAMPALAEALLDPRVAQDVPSSLESFLPQAGPQAAALLCRWASSRPKLAKALNALHDGEQFAAALRSIKPPAPRKISSAAKTASVLPPPTQGGVRVLTIDAGLASPLPRSERLTGDGSGGVLVEDTRDEDAVSRVVDVAGERTLMTPDESGLYDVLTRAGTFEKCLVAIHPHTAVDRAAYAVLVRAEADAQGNRRWVNIHPSRVWVGKQYSQEEYRQWWSSLETSEIDPEHGYSRTYMLLGPRADASVPFCVTQERSANAYAVSFRDYVPLGRPTWSAGENYSGPACSGEQPNIVLQRPAGSALRSAANVLYVPQDYKLVRLWRDAAAEDRDTADCNMPCSPSEPEDLPLEPGSQLDWELGLLAKTAQLHVGADGTDYYVDKRRCSPPEALRELIVAKGFRETTARELLKEAATAWQQERRHIVKRVKYAAPELLTNAMTAPYMPEPEVATDSVMGSGQQLQLPLEQLLTAEPTNPAEANRELYQPDTNIEPDQGAMQAAYGAAQLGQRELFDSSMIGSLLKATRNDTLIDSELPGLMKGMNAAGRLLFKLYWRDDQFRERYGDSEMSELEDGLRNTFENLGDVVLFLLEQQVEPYQFQEDIDLGEAASQ